MDSKKTNLTPELKEIYDRVMNTSGAAPKTNPPLPTTPTSPTKPSAADATITGLTPNPLNPPTLPNVPVPPVTDSAPAPITPAVDATQSMPSLPSMPGAPVIAPNPEAAPSAAEQALTSTPARPISEGNTFSFNGTVKNEAAPAAAGTKEKKKAKISLPILIVLGVVFVAAWGVFWAVILGFIER